MFLPGGPYEINIIKHAVQQGDVDHRQLDFFPVRFHAMCTSLHKLTQVDTILAPCRFSYSFFFFLVESFVASYSHALYLFSPPIIWLQCPFTTDKPIPTRPSDEHIDCHWPPTVARPRCQLSLHAKVQLSLHVLLSYQKDVLDPFTRQATAGHPFVAASRCSQAQLCRRRTVPPKLSGKSRDNGARGKAGWL